MSKQNLDVRILESLQQKIDTLVIQEKEYKSIARTTTQLCEALSAQLSKIISAGQIKDEPEKVLGIVMNALSQLDKSINDEKARVVKNLDILTIKRSTFEESVDVIKLELNPEPEPEPDPEPEPLYCLSLNTAPLSNLPSESWLAGLTFLDKGKLCLIYM